MPFAPRDAALVRSRNVSYSHLQVNLPPVLPRSVHQELLLPLRHPLHHKRHLKTVHIPYSLRRQVIRRRVHSLILKKIVFIPMMHRSRDQIIRLTRRTRSIYGSGVKG